MPPARKIVSFSAEGEAEANRLRSLLAGAPADEEAMAQLAPLSPEGEARPDWSATLDNIGRMAALLRDQAERLATAEARVRQAEMRAEEAETWLRRLHQAVLDGLPVGRAA